MFVTILYVLSFNNGIHLLEDCIANLRIKNPNCEFILSGDLNSRISNKQPIIECENITCFLDNNRLTDLSSNIDVYKRKSEDLVKNTYGTSLIELCASFDFIILNGLCNSDSNGNFTIYKHLTTW